MFDVMLYVVITQITVLKIGKTSQHNIMGKQCTCKVVQLAPSSLCEANPGREKQWKDMRLNVGSGHVWEVG